jgi:purine-nucleoside phosphorylase
MMPSDNYPEQAAARIREQTSLVPLVALVLGSGLGDAVAGDVRVEHEFQYADLPGFPSQGVRGHPGRLALGDLYGVPAAVFWGRIHYYEGHGIGSTTLIARLAAELGAKDMILTNAAGGLNRALKVGQLMLIQDHLNFLGVNPLFGWRTPGGDPAFVSLAGVYNPRLIELAEAAARGAGVDAAKGVYACLPGPSFETPSETRFLAGAGADAVGMSTVPEAVASKALGMPVLAISCITNVAGSADTHEDVLAVAAAGARDLREILADVIPRLTTEEERWTAMSKT